MERNKDGLERLKMPFTAIGENMTDRTDNKIRYDMIMLGGYIAASIMLLLVAEFIPSGTGGNLLQISGNSDAPGVADTTVTAGDMNTLTLDALRGIAVLEVAEVEITLLRSRRRTIVRKWLPDGWVETWLRTTGSVRAGIDLSNMQQEDITLTTDSEGTHATIRLPAPQITHKELNDQNWGHSHNLWLWAPDRLALELRQEIRTAAYIELDERVLETGLLEEARSNVVEVVANALRALDITSVEIILEDDRIIEIGTRAVQNGDGNE